MFENNFTIYYKATIRLAMIFVFGIIIFSFIRTVYLFSYGNFSELGGFKSELINAYWVGLRFDATVLANGFFVIFILNLLILFPPSKTEKNINAIKKISYWYVSSIFVVFFAVLIVDYFFYMYFQSHLNELAFGIVNEPMAVLTSVWSDYPIAKVVVFYLGIVILLVYAVRKLFLKEYGIREKNMVQRISEVVFLIILYLLALRGSIGEFPISKHVDSYISANLFLNDLTLNGVFSFKEAFVEKIGKRSLHNLPPILRQSSFLSYLDVQEIYDTELNRSTDDTIDFKKLPLANTSKNLFLEENPPNVVFFLMESMSNYYLDLHSPTLNLLGSLEGQLQDCIIFRNFLPGGPSTAQALLGLMINNADIKFVQAQMSLPDTSLLSSVALPYLKAGYHTSFTTGQGLEWIRLDEFVPKQYFQSVEGRDKIFSEIENAEGSEWEVFDEFMLEYILRKLKNSNSKPQFIFSMSVSNHPPFDLPSSYKTFPVEIPPEMAGKIKTSKEIAIKNFTGYQYANDSLGRFLKRLRSSPLGENTIVIATGDHNILQLFQFSYMQLLQKLSVPLIIYVPDKYLAAGEIDTTRFASHKDIFPTIFNLSLSDATYLKTGNNLLHNSNSTEDYFALYDNRVAMNEDGVILFQERPVFYKWQERNRRLIEPTSLLKSPKLKRLLKKSTAYVLQMNALSRSGFIETHLAKSDY